MANEEEAPAEDKKKKKKEKKEKPELTPEEAAAKAKKRKKLVLFGGGGTSVLVLAGAAAFFLMGSSPDPDNASLEATTATENGSAGTGEAPDAEGSEAADNSASMDGANSATTAGPGATNKAAEQSPADSFGCSHTFKPYNLNLGNPLENRYIRIEISIEMGCDDTYKLEISKREAQLNDAIIGTIRPKSREFLLGPDGLIHLRKELLEAINQRMTRKIDAVYVTDILIE